MRHRFEEQFRQEVDCNYAAIPAIIAIVATGVGMIVQYSASSQAAANAAAIAQYNAQIQQQNAMVAYQMQLYQSQQAAAIAANNAQLAQAQTQIAIQRANVEQQNAQILRDQAESVREQQREEARRMRAESERRLGAIRAKYAGSGVTFEGSPLTVLADTAQLAETSVQDATYIAELEARKLLRASDVTEYNASLLRSEATITGQVAQANYESQIQAAKYDTLIAGAKQRIALNAAELTRYEGGVQAQAYQAQGTASLISGIGSMATSVGTMWEPGGALYKPYTPGLTT